jgi:hypothetical protein
MLDGDYTCVYVAAGQLERNFYSSYDAMQSCRQQG